MAKRLRKALDQRNANQIRESKIKATKRNTTHPAEWLKSDRLTNTGEDAEQQGLSFIHCW